MKNFGSRLKELRIEKRLKQAELAQKVGVSGMTISQWERSDTVPSGPNLLSLATALDTTPDFLISGSDTKIANQEATLTRLKPMSYAETNELNMNQFCMVPYYRDVKLSAGNGEECIEQTEKFDMPFQNHFFFSRRIKPENAVIVRVKGDSMEPKYEDGGVVLIDLADKEIIDGEIYAIRHFDVLRIKKLSISMNDGALIIESLNPKWEAVKVPMEQIENITIIGRVRWNANG